MRTQLLAQRTLRAPTQNLHRSEVVAESRSRLAQQQQFATFVKAFFSPASIESAMLPELAATGFDLV